MFTKIRPRKHRLAALAALAISVLILVIIYFAVIKSSPDSTRPRLPPGERQAQPIAKPSARPPSRRVRRLTACILAAGTDVGRIHDCQAQYRR